MPHPSDTSNCDQLVVNNLDLLELATVGVPRFARTASLDRDDLIGEGQIALIKAARRYDPNRGSFRRYALERIKGAMLDAIRRDHFLPRYARERGHRVSVVSFENRVGIDGRRLSETLVDHRPSVEEVVEQRAQLAEALATPRQQLDQSGVLTPSELEVLRGAACGETAEETAGRLSKSPDTVKTQRRTALRRLGAKSIAQAVYMAYDQLAA